MAIYHEYEIVISLSSMHKETFRTVLLNSDLLFAWEMASYVALDSLQINVAFANCLITLISGLP